MNKAKIFIFSFFIILSSISLFATEPAQNEKDEGQKIEQSQAQKASFKYLSAAIAVGVACIAGGFAVGKIGAAAMGAMSEKPEVSGKAIPFVGLAEGICLWGFLVALLIILL